MSPPPGGTPSPRHVIGGPVAVGLLFGLAAVGNSAVAVALPAVERALGLTTAHSVWVLSLYALALAVSTAFWGGWSDIVGVRLPLVVGAGLMTTGSLAASFSVDLGWLLTSRVVQGTGAGAMVAMAPTMISRTHEGDRRTAAMGLVAAIAAGLSCVGPLVGGVLEHLVSWRLVVAIPALGLVVVAAIAEACSNQRGQTRFDPVGAAFFTTAATGTVLLVQSPSMEPVVAVTGALLLGMGVIGVLLQRRRKPHGFLPRSLTRDRVLMTSAVVAASIPAAWFAMLVAIPDALATRGWPTLAVGLLLLPSAIAGFATAMNSGRIVHRLGGGVPGLLAAALGAAVSLATAALGVIWASALLFVMATCLVTSAFGVAQPALMTIVHESVRSDIRGVALGLASMIYLSGGALGAGILGGLGPGGGLAVPLLLIIMLPTAGSLALHRISVVKPIK